MITKKKSKGKTGGRQAKMTASGSLTSSSSLAVTKPSPFAEVVHPIIPEFCIERPKKRPGRAPKQEKEDPTQTKLDFSDKTDLEVGEGGGGVGDGTEPVKEEKKKRAPKRPKKAAGAAEGKEKEGEDSTEKDEPAPKKRAPRKKTKEADEPSEGDFKAKKTKKKPEAKKQTKIAFETSGSSGGKSPQKKKPAKKRAKKEAFSDDESEDDLSDIGSFSDEEVRIVKALKRQPVESDDEPVVSKKFIVC